MRECRVYTYSSERRRAISEHPNFNLVKRTYAPLIRKFNEDLLIDEEEIKQDENVELINADAKRSAGRG